MTAVEKSGHNRHVGEIIKRQGRKTCLHCNRSLSTGALTYEVGTYEVGGWSTNSAGFCRVPTHEATGPLAYHAGCLVEARWQDARSRARYAVELLAEEIEMRREMGHAHRLHELHARLDEAQQALNEIEENKP